MYQINDSIYAVKGVGTKLKENFSELGIETILDLLLFLPLRYEDRSQILKLKQLKNIENSYLVEEDKANKEAVKKKTTALKIRKNLYTVKGKLLSFNQYYKGRLLISRGTIGDGEEKINCLWFNNKFLKNKVKIGQEYFFSGEFKKDTLQQATVEEVKTETIHTGRLLPIYSQSLDLKQGSLRRIFQEVHKNLKKTNDQLCQIWQQKRNSSFLSFDQYLMALHFPKEANEIILARELLAYEEIYYLITQAAKMKAEWQKFKIAEQIKLSELIPNSLPFTLTRAQERAVGEICHDLESDVPMNRLLIGDVGSGKTLVAALAARQVINNGHNVALLAPTKILAGQHQESLKRIFPEIKIIPVFAGNKKTFNLASEASLYIGTHALLNKLDQVKPALVIYDEQQRFGVEQRQVENYLHSQRVAKKNIKEKFPHLLSMTATPIPRTFMLSIFAHLNSSYLDEMPKNRQIANTWLINQEKEQAALEWIAKELVETDDNGRQKQMIVVCPFIDPSRQQSLSNVAAVKETYQDLTNKLNQIYAKMQLAKADRPQMGILHSRIKKPEQEKVIAELYAEKIQILVTTAMVEVGVDLPNADIILIYGAERFGLASLHQLRGRVGRQGQQSYCLLFPSPQLSEVEQKEKKQQLTRLKKFCLEKDGFKLAQLDLENRGAGNIFGLNQSGFSNLRFASWTNQEIISQAQETFQSNQENKTKSSLVLANYLEKFQAKIQQVAAN